MSNGEMKYREAGVDLEAAERSMRSIGVLVQSTVDARTLSQVGGF